MHLLYVYQTCFPSMHHFLTLSNHNGCVRNDAFGNMSLAHPLIHSCAHWFSHLLALTSTSESGDVRTSLMASCINVNRFIPQGHMMINTRYGK